MQGKYTNVEVNTVRINIKCECIYISMYEIFVRRKIHRKIEQLRYQCTNKVYIVGTDVTCNSTPIISDVNVTCYKQ